MFYWAPERRELANGERKRGRILPPCPSAKSAGTHPSPRERAAVGKKYQPENWLVFLIGGVSATGDKLRMNYQFGLMWGGAGWCSNPCRLRSRVLFGQPSVVPTSIPAHFP